MHKSFSGILALGLIVASMAVSPFSAHARSGHGAPAASMPKVGDVAPDFKLKYVDGKHLKEVSLADYRGKKNVVLAFYIFAFTGG